MQHLWNRARLGAGDAPEKLIPLLDDIILIDPKDENAWFNKANCFMNMQVCGRRQRQSKLQL